MVLGLGCIFFFLIFRRSCIWRKRFYFRNFLGLFRVFGFLVVRREEGGGKGEV